MAAVSAWTKPGAWAIDAEQQDHDKGYSSSESSSSLAKPPPSTDFPSLAAAAKTKTKKKKAQTIALAEFTTASKPLFQSSRSSAPEAPLVLPTGPRERSPEELDRPRGFGYSSYGRGRGDESRGSDEPRRGGVGRDSGPSRADETDDWGAGKRAMGPPPRERERGAGFFGDSQSRADESDSWVSNRSGPRGFEAPRERRGGFETINREGPGVDSDTWGRRREEVSSLGGRQRLALQPRTQPLADSNNNNNNNNKTREQPEIVVRSKGANPFGEARPREEVLKAKGQDWKEIDEKLESVKIREAVPEGQQLGRKGFRNGNEGGSAAEDRTDRAWRKPEPVEAPREEKPEEIPGN